MKWLGILMVLGGCLGFTILSLEEMKRHMERLEEWRTALEWMEGEIRYGKISFPECFIRIGGRMQTPLGDCFERAGRRMRLEPQKNIRDLLEEELRQGLRPAYQEETSGELLSFLAPDGFWDEQMQRKALERIRESVEELLREKKGEYGGKRKVGISVGIAVGSMIILFLI